MQSGTRSIVAPWLAQWTIAVLVGMPAVASAQNEPLPPQHIYLPPTFGATALSTQINAQAAYIAAQGDFLVSASVARRNNALAAEQEMRNAVQWVKTYFERRELNRQYRLKEHPPYLDKEELRHKQTRRRIVDDPYLASKGDPSDDLNWLLEELSAVWLDFKYLPREQALADSEADTHLDLQDIHHIRLTDGSQSSGRQFIFRADEAKPLQTDWPFALQGPEFNELREAFEILRDQVLKESRERGGVSHESQAQLMQAVDLLCDKFNKEYPPERRTESSNTYAIYTNGKRFLRTLASGVYRLIESNDRRAFDGSYRFQGDSLVDLVDHMTSCGLQFAKPEPGDDATYRKLFFGFRHLFTSVESQQPKPPEKGS